MGLKPVIEPPVNTDYRVVYEDSDLLVINKPSDLPCHPGGIYFENTLWYILKQKYEHVSFVNRFDREISGTILIAKSKGSASFYSNKIMEHEIEKEYLVLVHGILMDDINARGWLIKDSDSSIRKKESLFLMLMHFRKIEILIRSFPLHPLQQLKQTINTRY